MADASRAVSEYLRDWINTVHSSLQDKAVELQSAAWGPVTARHRTTRRDWFGPMDRAWAQPIDRGESVDVITAAFADLPEGIDPPALRPSDVGLRGELLLPPGCGLRMTWNEHRGEVVAWDADSGAAVLLRRHPPEDFDLVSPMRLLVHWTTAACGGMLVHGAAIGVPRGGTNVGLLILGDPGYGKSTTTLAALAHGWVTCGDDAVALHRDETGWRACSIYAAVKTKLDHQAPPDLPPLGADIMQWDVSGTKRAHLLTSTDESTLRPVIALVGVVMLDPHAQPNARFRSTPAPNVRTRGAISSMTHLPYDGQVILTGFGQLAKELPAYSLPRRPLLAETVADLADILRMCEPAVSVVMPMYNGSRYVADGVRSILAQTIGRFEIIGVDDASPDDSRVVLEALRTEIQDAGHTLRVVRLDTNQGPGGARNAGLEVATDDYIAFLDQDDLWPRERTAVLWAALKASGALVAQGRMSFEDVGSPSERRWVRQRWFDHDDHPGHALGALLCRREALPEVGVLNPAFSAGVDDIDWLMRARSAGIPWLSVPQVSLIRRIHDTNFSRRSSHTQLLAVVRTHYQRQHVEDC